MKAYESFVKHFMMKNFCTAIANISYYCHFSAFLNSITPPVIGLELLERIDLLPVLKQGIRCLQLSSYDRAGGNDDGFSGYSSYLYMDGTEYVIFDSSGPGCIYRIWATRRSDTDFGTLKFYFDGEPAPRINMSFDEFFSGTVSPFLAPLVGNRAVSSGGFYCYLPIPFKKSLIIKCTGQPRYFISPITYMTMIRMWKVSLGKKILLRYVICGITLVPTLNLQRGTRQFLILLL